MNTWQKAAKDIALQFEKNPPKLAQEQAAKIIKSLVDTVMLEAYLMAIRDFQDNVRVIASTMKKRAARQNQDS